MRIDKYGRAEVNFTWKDMEVRAYVIYNDYEGDMSEPGLWRKAPAYVDEIEILTPTGIDLLDDLSAETENHICDMALERFYEGD